MNFTFGIITNNGPHLDNIVNSIQKLQIPNYEIIIVGKSSNTPNKSRFIEFKDSSHNFAISEKKNIITKTAVYENIVYLHDYISFCENWYAGFLQFGNNFSVCMNRVLDQNNNRFRDWCLWKDDAENFVAEHNYLLSYEITHLSKMMYIPGSYWVAKKEFMLENPLNEKLKWEQGEDVEWSIRARNKVDFKLNLFSTVKLLKEKNRIFNEISEEEKQTLLSIKKYDNEKAYENLIERHLKTWI